MTLDEARRILNSRSGSLHENAAAAAFVTSYYSNEGRRLTRPATFTTDAARPRDDAFARKLARFKDGLKALAPRRRTRDQASAKLTHGQPMPLPSGDALRAIRINDQAQSERKLRQINRSNRGILAAGAMNPRSAFLPNSSAIARQRWERSCMPSAVRS